MDMEMLDRLAKRNSLPEFPRTPKVNQLDLFEETPQEQKPFVLFPRYKIAFLRNAYWSSSVDHFLAVEKNDFTTDYKDLIQKTLPEHSLLSRGYTIRIPNPPKALSISPRRYDSRVRINLENL